jgi:hypothetical protein
MAGCVVVVVVVGGGPVVQAVLYTFLIQYVCI